jgi:hypothetical protein
VVSARAAISSVAIILFNKQVLGVYHFDFPCLLVLSHMVLSIVFLLVLRQRGLITFPDFDMTIASKVDVIRLDIACAVGVALTCC